MEELTKKQKWIFIIRAIAWFLLAGALPFIFISFKFGIFEPSASESLKLSGWAIIGIVIFAITIIRLAGYIYKGMKPGIFKQCIKGVITTVIPLVAIYMLLEGIANNIDSLKKCLACIIVCETIAIPINPFPVWVYNKYGEKFSGLIDLTLDKIAQRKKENENK